MSTVTGVLGRLVDGERRVLRVVLGVWSGRLAPDGSCLKAASRAGTVSRPAAMPVGRRGCGGRIGGGWVSGIGVWAGRRGDPAAGFGGAESPVAGVWRGFGAGGWGVLAAVEGAFTGAGAPGSAGVNGVGLPDAGGFGGG